MCEGEWQPERARARRLARQCGKLGLIIVDYLQLMQGSKPGDNRASEISEISRSLKGLAKELGCPVIALSQLQGAAQNRPHLGISTHLSHTRQGRHAWVSQQKTRHAEQQIHNSENKTEAARRAR